MIGNYKEGGDMMNMRLNRILNENMTYDVFRSEVSHMYQFEGECNFVIDVVHHNAVVQLWQRGSYDKSLYLLAMIDYISWKNNVPALEDYQFYRKQRLVKTKFPPSIEMLDSVMKTDENKRKAIAECREDECGRFFYRHNIIERSF